ncbi:DUF5661 family protein [Methylicorpusculum sp.]|uniref:DUF5661 family protein n=1 Tax=Methylicorpusculum sp. TaxID=2713644 RepID=UPI002ABC2F66|nr:DUF5661 family protein [Methylicorpusculum sp.]MDZ4150873.1 DUF5661 family protein [Methylicorpusculum sp.]
MKRWLLLSTPNTSAIGMFIIRVGVGLIFVGHGFLKIMGGPETWLWLGSQMANFGIAAWPTAWGFAAMASEFLGGICLTLGFATRIAAFFMSTVMIVAFRYHMAHGDAYALYSYPLTMLAVLVGFLVAGAGAYSLDAMLARRAKIMGKLTPENIKSQAKTIGDALGVDWRTVDLQQFAKGLAVELEHGSHDPETDVTHDDALKTGKIALAHLKEFSDYYTRLEKVERE